MKMKTIKKYWEQFLDWEEKKLEFDNGFALLITITFILAVVK